MTDETRQRQAGVAMDLDVDDVWSAIELWHQVGRAEFLKRFGVGGAVRYVVVDGSDEFDALALLVGARHLSGKSVARAYRGDRRNVADPLRALGFFVEDVAIRDDPPVDVRTFDFASWLSRFDGATDQVALVHRRREQAALRAALGIEPEGRARCGICGRDLPADLMAAAHIKPRAECSPRERTDAPWVVMPACRMGCDSLFELGYIGVGDGGVLLVSEECPIAFKGGQIAPAWRDEREKYFSWHRRHRLRK